MTFKKNIKVLISKWALISIGVSLTVASAIISNYSINQNNDEIDQLERNARNLAQQIEEVWENTRSLEKRKNTAVILLVQNPLAPQTRAFVIDTFELLNSYIPDDISYHTLERAFEDYKEGVITIIDDKYIVQQAYLDSVQSIKMDNDVLLNIALCFQILGLLFVLSRGSI